jgi:uncharacterized membrane protein
MCGNSEKYAFFAMSMLMITLSITLSLTVGLWIANYVLLNNELKLVQLFKLAFGVAVMMVVWYAVNNTGPYGGSLP